jgi:two-component system, cell cycle sensor histidine kinase and response regulator CckA
MTSTPLRILHLEENPRDLQLIQSLLKEELSCLFRSVRTGDEFVSALEQGAFDLILSDRGVPGFNGFSALETAREKAPDTPFIFVTGSMGEELAAEALKSGAADYVLKIQPARLIRAVERALEEAKTRQTSAQTEERFREQAMLLNEAHDAILVCDLDLTFRYWNQGAEVLYGWSASDAAGKSFIELLCKGHSRRVEEARKQVLAEGRWSGELMQFSREGKVVITGSSWKLVRSKTGQAHSILVINSDITQKKQYEAQFFRGQRLESIGVLAGGIAHDLNNVLAPILMVSELLRMQIQDPNLLKLLDTLQRSAQHGAGLINQIMAFARGVQGAHIQIQMEHLIRETQKVLKETWPQSIAIETSIPKNVWTIKGAPAQLNQVLINLCSNARDAMPSGGTLTLSVENVTTDESHLSLHPDAKRGRYVAITVRDTGTGIPEEIIKQVYGPFLPNKKPGKPAGLGLSTVKGIVKYHGGFIQVSSAPDQGAQFKLYFPAEPPAALGPGPEARADLPRGSGERILVVDDEPAVLEMTRMILERQGYEIVTAENGAEALAVFSMDWSQIHLVLMDVVMPVMDGIATIQAMQKLEPAVKIIVMGGGVENSKNSYLNENWEIITKPYSAEKLLTAIKNTLRR